MTQICKENTARRQSCRFQGEGHPAHTEREWLSPTSGKPWMQEPKPFRLHTETAAANKEKTPEFIRQLCIYQENKNVYVLRRNSGSRGSWRDLHSGWGRQATDKQTGQGDCTESYEENNQCDMLEEGFLWSLGQEGWSPQLGAPERTWGSKGSGAGFWPHPTFRTAGSSCTHKGLQAWPP